MKRILIKWVKWLSCAGAVVIGYYLYMNNLGAIPFLLLSIYFFRKAKQMYTLPEDRTSLWNRMKKGR